MRNHLWADDAGFVGVRAATIGERGTIGHRVTDPYARRR